VSSFGLLWGSVRSENRRFWRTPIAAFFTLGLPLVMLVLFVALFGNDPQGTSDYGPLATAQFYAPGLGVFAASSATFTNLAMNLTTRREAGILMRVRNTPLPPWVFLTGAVLSAVWLALLSLTVMIAVGVVGYGVDLRVGQLPAQAVAFLAGAVAFATLGVAVASVSSSLSTAQALANFTILPLAFVSNVFIALDQPPRWMSTTADVFPLKSFAVAFTATMNGERGWSDLPLDRLGVLGAWTVVGILVAARSFRWAPQANGSSADRRGSSRRRGREL